MLTEEKNNSISLLCLILVFVGEMRQQFSSVGEIIYRSETK